MKIFIICSKRFYPFIPEVKQQLEKLGHEITLPNCYDNPYTENEYRGTKGHAAWKAKMFKQSEQIIQGEDAVLILNLDTAENKSYIGGATFLEMYDAFRLDKKIYMINYPKDSIIKDEIIGFEPVVIGYDFEKIGE